MSKFFRRGKWYGPKEHTLEFKEHNYRCNASQDAFRDNVVGAAKGFGVNALVVMKWRLRYMRDCSIHGRGIVDAMESGRLAVVKIRV